MTTTYRGTEIPFAKHADDTTERAYKVIAFPAVDGTYEMKMGKRQKPISIEGHMVDIAGSFTKTTIENWNDGDTGILVINGVSYTNVVMRRCSYGRAYRNAVTGKTACTFVIEFRKIQ